MRASRKRTRRTGSLLAAGVWVAAVAVAAIAVPPANAAGARRHHTADECISGAVGKPMNEHAQKQLLEAIEAMDANRLDESLKILDRIGSHSLGNYGRGLVFQMRAGIAAARDDLEGAARYMTQSVDSGGFCGERLTTARMQLAQILTALERWDDAIAQLEQVIASSPTPNGEAYYRIGLALYRANRVDEAIAAAEKAVAIGGADVKEPWWQLLLQIHWDRQEFEQCLPILNRLVTENPRRDYWLRLGFALFELKRPAEALVAMQVADTGGYLDESADQLRLVQLEFGENIPARAAERLEKAIDKGAVPADQKTLEVLSNAWLAARDRERSIAVLERAAAMSADGRDWLRVAQIRAQLDDWKEVARTTTLALGKGSLEDAGMAYLLLGMAHFNLKEIEPARAAFTRALAFEKTRTFASNWLAATAETSGTAAAAGSATGEGQATSSIQ